MAKTVFEEMYQSGKPAEEIVKQKGDSTAEQIAAAVGLVVSRTAIVAWSPRTRDGAFSLACAIQVVG